MRIVATENQEVIQHRTKHGFDKTSSTCDFQIGDEVLVFTPDLSSSKKRKLDNTLTGPYEVSAKSYAIDRPDQRRGNAAVHATAMKKWMPPIADTLFLSTSDKSETTELPD